MAMVFANRLCQALHEEHLATIALIERLERLIARQGDRMPEGEDQSLTQLLTDLSVVIDGELERHFACEEDHLFSYLETAGDAAIGAHLMAEHGIIRPLGARIASLARDAAAHGFDAAGWETFRRHGRDLCDQLLAHIQKEEIALLPLIEEMMDADAEARLYERYVEHV